MKKFLGLFALFLVLSVSAHAAPQSRTSLKTAIDSSMPSNSQITAATLRSVLFTTLDSVVMPLSDVVLPANGGLGVAWTDPNADALVGWKDSTGVFQAYVIGSGFSTLNSVLNPAIALNTQTGPSYNMVASDCTKLVRTTNSSPVSVTIPSAASAGFTLGCGFVLNADGAGSITFTPNLSTINGAASLTIPAHTGCTINSDGANWIADVSSCPALAGNIFNKTITAGGTTGSQTINKPAGTVNFAATATSLTVTNNLVTTGSLVFATVRTADSTALIKNVVPAAGSFTINLNAAATAETSVGFFVAN